MVRIKNKKNSTEIQSAFHKIYYEEIAPLMRALECKRWIELLKCIVVIIALVIILPICVKYSLHHFYSNSSMFVAIGSVVGASWFLYYMITLDEKTGL